MGLYLNYARANAQCLFNWHQILHKYYLGFRSDQKNIKIESKNKIYFTKLLTKHAQPIFHLIMNLFEI